MKYLRTKIGGLILTSFFLLGVATVMGTSAQAQGRWDRDRDRQVRRDSNRGNWDRDRDRYRDRGTDWNRDRRVYRAPSVVVTPRVYSRPRVYTAPGNYGYYGNGGNYGYYGNGGNYGYGNGGNNGYYGNGGNYGAGAQSQGYQDGFSTGSNDARRGQSYDPQRSHYYRNEGGNGAYRSGFLRGYAEGWRSAGGRRFGW